ncbi:hypothetical protein [Devosia sp. 1566]|nr:hypothetical protein [Devosia sp. 1566]
MRLTYRARQRRRRAAKIMLYLGLGIVIFTPKFDIQQPVGGTTQVASIR